MLKLSAKGANNKKSVKMIGKNQNKSISVNFLRIFIMATLFEELPYAFVISTSKNSQCCHFCCKFSASGKPSLRRCSGCRFAHYCDEKCQKNAWNDHALECRRLKNVLPRVPTDMARLMARILDKKRMDRDSEKDSKRTFAKLISHVDEIQNDVVRMEHFTYIFAILKEFVGEGSLPSSAESLEIFGKICINSFNLLSDDDVPIGIGLYIELSALDHSCDPDAVVIFDGCKAVLNSIKGEIGDYKVAKISYIELLHPSTDRKRQLKEQYYFDCTCSRCGDGYQDRVMTALRCSGNFNCDGLVLVSDDGQTTTCEKCGRCGSSWNEMMMRIKLQLLVLDQNKTRGVNLNGSYEIALNLLMLARGSLHSVNVYYIRLSECAFDLACQLEDWNMAISHAEDVLTGYKQHFPSGHPSITYQLAKIGKIMQLLGQLENAEVFLQQALDAAKLSHGTKHPLFETISELLASCREEKRVRLSLDKFD